MGSHHLEQIRCESCQKLLFRGIVGLGFIEVKCSRCGHVNVINSYDAMLHNTPGAYVLVYDSRGGLIAHSKSAEKILGYTTSELNQSSMQDIDASFPRITPTPSDHKMTRQEWEDMHKNLPKTALHKTKKGENSPKAARYYPIDTFTGVYSVGIFYPSKAE